MKDLTGKRFGKLVVIKRDEQDSSKCVCKCDCGNYTSIYMHNLTSGKSKSCGCERGFLAGRKGKDTKCWECKNISFCEWSKGVPVPNWVAVPTIIKSRGGVRVKSFDVINCPKFEKREFKCKTKNEIRAIIIKKAEEMGVSERTLRRKIKKGEIVI